MFGKIGHLKIIRRERKRKRGCFPPVYLFQVLACVGFLRLPLLGDLGRRNGDRGLPQGLQIDLKKRQRSVKIFIRNLSFFTSLLDNKRLQTNFRCATKSLREDYSRNWQHRLRQTRTNQTTTSSTKTYMKFLLMNPSSVTLIFLKNPHSSFL